MRQLAIEHFLDLDISAGEGVADDDQVGGRGQVFCVERTGEWNGKRFEERRGRRIYARVGASDPVAAFAQHARERSHGRAADANHVDVLHVCFVISPSKADHALPRAARNDGQRVTNSPRYSTTAGSSMANRPSPFAAIRTRTPRGRVSMGRSV